MIQGYWRSILKSVKLLTILFNSWGSHIEQEKYVSFCFECGSFVSFYDSSTSARSVCWIGLFINLFPFTSCQSWQWVFAHFVFDRQKSTHVPWSTGRMVGELRRKKQPSFGETNQDTGNDSGRFWWFGETVLNISKYPDVSCIWKVIYILPILTLVPCI